MVTRVLSIVRSADPGAPRPGDPVLNLNAYAVAEDVELTLVLKAAGVELALAGTHARPATVGGIDVPAPAAAGDLEALLASRVRILAVEEDLAGRGLVGDDLLPGIETIGEADLGGLIEDHDVNLTWSIS